MKSCLIITCSALLSLLLVPVYLTAQEKKILSAEEFINIVREFHPVAKQASLQVERAKAEITIARGAFDPSVYLDKDQKTFDGKNYYSYSGLGLKIPTWYGIEVKGGLENNGGQLLNSEITPGPSGYIGLSVPIAKNLVMDKRRAVLLQAKLYREQTETERLNTMNDLLYEAYAAYWEWARAHRVYEIVSSTVKVNEARVELVKIGIRQGDRPAIDSIEAITQLQNFQYQQSESLVSLQNARVDMSAFLWLPDNRYYNLGDDVTPDVSWSKDDIASLLPPDIDKVLDEARTGHPKFRVYDYKLQGLAIERKLKAQSLLPTVNVKGYLLNKGYDVFSGIGKFGMYENNNKFGIDIGLPLRLSEGRGAYRVAKIKIQETNLALELERMKVENKIRTYYNEMIGLLQQVKIYERAYQNYQALFRGEDTRFQAGESSLFLLNQRENKQLESLQKLMELKTKLYKTKQAVLWAAGQLK